MLYQDYKAKINKRVKIRRILRKYRVPIICTISAIIMLITAFTITKGMVFGDTLELNKIEYGNKPSFTASAVFSDVRYEFSAASGGEWSTEVPVHMGEYKMRVVSSGLFGERYSEEQYFSIVPRNIYVTAKEKTVVYGEKPTATATLAFGDKIYCNEFVFEDTTKQTTTVTPVKANVVVKDKSGKDVTGCYNVIAKPTDITFTPRSIEITVEPKEIVYNGEFLVHEVWDVTGGSLAYGDDVVKVVENSFSSIKGVGSTENKGEFYVERNGVDVTHQYSITQHTGTLTITKRPLVIITPDKEYTYTGAERYDYDLEFEPSPETPLANENHVISIDDIVARLTTVGEIENKHEYRIVDEDGNNVTDNYSITHVSGKLRVVPREVTVQTATEEETYNGKEWEFKSFDVISENKLAAGHSFKILEFTRATAAVDGLENKMTLDIVDGNDESVIKNYALTYAENGTITIKKKKIEISSDSLPDDSMYSGKPQGIEGATYDPSELIEGHELVTSKWSTVTDCSDEPVDNDFTVTIFDSDKKPVTDNYEIVKHLGKLQLKPLVINVVSNSADKVYDGEELSAPGFEYAQGSPELVKGHTYNVVSSTSIVNAETVENKIELEILETLKDGSTKDVGFNYDVKVTPGTLRIDPRSIVVTSLGFADPVYYDGEKHRCEEYELTSEYENALVEGHEVRVEFLESSYVDTAIGEVENRFRIRGVFVKKTDPNEEDVPVTKNYAIATSFAALRLEKRPVAFGSLSMPTDEDNRVIYDGDYHSVEECVTLEVDESNLLANMGLVAGHTPVGYGFSRVIDAEEIDNVFEVVDILDASGESVFGNYAITGYKYGKLKVFPRPIILISGSDSKMYDGTALTKTGGIEFGGYGLISAHYMQLISSASITNVLIENGEVVGIPNTFEYEIRWQGNGLPVRAENYVVTGTEYGTLTITKRPITITTGNAERVYNGSALTKMDADITVGSLADNQTISYSNYALLTNVAYDGDLVVGITNSCSYSISWVGGGEVALTNYEITESFGELLVTKRPVNIQIQSPSKEYDGTALNPSGFDVEKSSGNRGILAGHNVHMDLYGEQIKAGSLKIGHSEATVSGDNTGNYDITVIDGYLTVTPRNVMIILDQETTEYTGYEIGLSFDGSNVYYVDQYGVSYGSLGLADGDTIDADFANAVGPGLGFYDVSIVESSIIITNRNGEDVTDSYNIRQIINGYVEITRRKIIINILNGYKEYYDGAPVKSAGYDVDNFLDQLHEIDMTILGEQTNVTTDPITGEKHLGVASLLADSITIADKTTNTDASQYYEIVAVNNGTLEVEKRRPVTITSADAFFTYNGSEQTKNEYTFSDMCPEAPMQREEEPYVVFDGETPILPGSYENHFKAEMRIKGTTQETTPNYDITYDFGNIVIGGIKIEVTTPGATKVYDGAPLTTTELGTYILAEDTPDIPGLVIKIIPTGTQTDVIKGEFGIFSGSENTYRIEASINGSPLGEDAVVVTKKSLGELIVTPLEIEVHTNTVDDNADVGIVFGTTTVVGWDGSAAEENLRMDISEAFIGLVDRVQNVPTIRLFDKATDEPVSRDNFKFSDKSTFGTLTLRATKEIVVTSDSTLFDFDGTPKIVNNILSDVGGPFNSANHYIQTDGYLEFISVGEYDNTFEVVDIIDLETGESVMDLYPSIRTVAGKINIEPMRITISAPNVIENADDIAVLEAPDYIVEPNAVLDKLNKNYYGYKYGYEIDWSLANSGRPSISGVGERFYTIPKECFFVTLNGERLPQDSVIVTCVQGQLKLSDKLVEIGLAKKSFIYNGQWRGYDDDSWWWENEWENFELIIEDIDEFGLVEVGVINLDEMCQTLRANNKIRLIYTDEYGFKHDVTDEYDYKFVCSKPLTVKKIELTIVAGSKREVFEQGKTLTYDKYELQGSLLSGHRIEECVVIGSASGIGSVDNLISSVKIVDGSGNDVSHLYNINRVAGTLTLFKDEQ